MKNNLKLKILIAILIGIFITFLTQFFSYRSITQLNNTNVWVIHTYRVKVRAVNIENIVLQLESNIRGYGISRNQLFLSNYESLLQNLKININLLSILSSDNNVQVSNIIRLRSYVEERIRFLNLAVKSVKTGDLSTLPATVRSGKLYTDLIFSTVEDIQKEEDRLLVMRNTKSNSLVSLVFGSILFSGILELVIMLFFLSVIFRDLNKQKELENKLKADELRLSQFLEALPVGIMVLDKSGNAHYANQKSFELLGRGIAPADSKLEEYAEIFKAYKVDTNTEYPVGEMPIALALQGKTTRIDDMEIKKPGGDQIQLEVNARPVYDINGNIEFSIASFDDITKRKKSEAKLKDAIEVAEQSVKLRDSFLANMSHEIRTPLNAIIGFAAMLNKSSLNDEQKKYTGIIKDAGENLLALINDILDVSRIEAGMMQFEKIPFSLPGLLDSLRVLFSVKAQEKKVGLSIDVHEKIPSVLEGDPTRLTQILINLIGNAIKFTKEGGVFVNVFLQNETANEAEIIFYIKDTGIGIPAEKINSIFERFQQADLTTTRNYGGTGLGLSIVKNLVVMQGGNLQVESQEGIGSTFSFTIPYCKVTTPVENTEHNGKERRLYKLGKLHTLVVEDNVINQLLFQKILQDEFHFEVDIAENGKEAIKLIQQKNYDVILMDIQMPIMDGYETVVYLRRELNLTTPIVAMTAHAMSGEKEKCIRMGFSSYISKPIDEDSLYNVIGLALKATEIKPDSESKNDDSILNGITENANRITDLTYFNKLSKGDYEFALKIISVFLKEIPENVEKMKKAIHQEDWEELRTISHKINPSLKTMGIYAASDAMIQIEELATQKINFDLIKDLVAQSGEIIEQAIKELEKEKR